MRAQASACQFKPMLGRIGLQQAHAAVCIDLHISDRRDIDLLVLRLEPDGVQPLADAEFASVSNVL